MDLLTILHKIVHGLLPVHHKTVPRLLPVHQQAELCYTVRNRLNQNLTMAQGSSSAPSLCEFPAPIPTTFGSVSSTWQGGICTELAPISFAYHSLRRSGRS